MNITVQFNGVKRSISGPFMVCASDVDFRLMKRAIDDFLADKRSTYGWIEVTVRPEIGPEGPPLTWGEGA